MQARKKVWGWVFIAVVVFTAAITADIALNKALNVTYLYANLGGNHIPAEALAIAVLTLPLTALISGIQYLRYFVKLRKAKRQEAAVAV